MSEAFKSQPATISKADVVSNSDTEKTASLVNGIIRLTYFESILQDSIKASIVFKKITMTNTMCHYKYLKI